MARPSKTQQFAIYQAGGTENVDNIPTPDAGNVTRNDGTYKKYDQKREPVRSSTTGLDRDVGDEDDEDFDQTCLAPATFEHADDERRQSGLTSTSISSYPESTFETDCEDGLMHKPYTPPVIRPSFRRPESVRRMQMSSPTPSDRNLRRSVLLPPRARTSRSNRSSVKGSPRPRRVQERELEEEQKDYPLVLLHISLLPVELRWSLQSKQEILPANILESLQLLKSKVSETVADRGILIPHPRDEYELLEDRLLEALELKKERVTKCGHFRARNSTSSTSSADSGIATSVESLEEEFCETCHHHLRPSEGVVSSGGRKWSIKVFAANGLMRSSAWAAAWSEMENVDVEILPYIGEDLRKRLDSKVLEEEAQLRAKHEEEDARIKEMAEQQIRLAREERRMMRNIRKSHHIELGTPPNHCEENETASAAADSPSRKGQWDELPQVYQPKDIPLSLLLKNYLYLLAQERRNVIISALILLTLLMGFGVAHGPKRFDMPPMALTPQDLGAETNYDAVPEMFRCSIASQDSQKGPRSHTGIASPMATAIEVASVTSAAEDVASAFPAMATSAPEPVVQSEINHDLCLNEASVGHLFGSAETLASLWVCVEGPGKHAVQ